LEYRLSCSIGSFGLSTGIGKVTVKNGNHTGALAGAILRHN